MADDIETRMTLRLPGSLQERLRMLSQENKRSLNAEIVDRLEGSITSGFLFDTSEIHEIRLSLSRKQSAMTQKEREWDLVEDLLFYEEQMHKTAKELRKIKRHKQKSD